MTLPTGLQLKPAGEACLTCPARTGVCVPTEVNPNSKLTLIGEAPGWNEKEAGKPFVGKSGRMLDRGLKTIGLNREQVSWTNAVLCSCDDDDLNVARKHCEKRLHAELAQIGSPIVIPVGKYALQSALKLHKAAPILGKRGYRGSVQRVEIASNYSPLVCPTLHPAAVMRASDAQKRINGALLELDMKRVGRLLSAPEAWLPPEDRPGHTLIIVKSFDDLAGINELAPIVSFDVETTFDGATKNRLVCFGFSDGKTTYVVPWSQDVTGLQPYWTPGGESQILRWINKCFESRTVVTHNGPAFDHVVAGRFGIKIEAWDDTLLQTHALRSHLPKGLNHVVSICLDAPAWKEVPHTDDLDQLMFYNGQDALYTVLSFFVLREQMEAA